MLKKINCIFISTYIFIVPSSLAFEVVVTNEMNEVQNPFIEGLDGLAPDSVGGWIFPNTNRIYDNSNIWLTSGAIDLKEGDKREIKMADASCGRVEFKGEKNVTFFKGENGFQCRVLNTPSLNGIYKAANDKQCDDGRILTELEFNLFQNKNSNLCIDTNLWGDSLIGVEKNDGSIEYFNPQDGNVLGKCLTLTQTCNDSQDKCIKANYRPKNLLCVANPLDNQILAYTASDFSAGNPLTGSANLKITHDDLAGKKVYNGEYSSFKLGDNLELHGFTQANLGGQKIVFEAGIHPSSQKIKSFFVKTAEPKAPELGSGAVSYVSNKMDINLITDPSSKNCTINISSTLASNARIDDIFATIATIDNNNDLFKTERVKIPFTYSDIDDNGVPKQAINGTVQVNMADNKANGFSQCIVTKVEITDMGRAELSFPDNASSAVATWYEIPENSHEIDNELHAVQLLAEPLIFKFTGYSKPNYNRITHTYSRSEQHKNLRNSIVNGSTGVSAGYYGFSVDFLALSTREAINDFLLETVVNPAYQLGVISEELNNTDFAEELRREIMAELGQDAFHDYGSLEHIERSIAMMFSGVVPTHLQRNRLTENINIDMDSIFSIHHEYMNKPLPPMQKGDVFSTDDNGDEDVTPLDLYGDLTFSSSNEDTRTKAFQQLFGLNNNIIVDYSKGLISYRSRQGGYLGTTYLKVASDIFKIEAKELTPSMKRITEMALLSLGIDTVYTYGSIRSIKSNILHRVSSNISIPEEFETHLFSGGAPEMLDTMKEKLYPGVAETPFDEQARTMLRNIFNFSNLPHPPPESKIPELWDLLVRLDKVNDELYDLEGVVETEEDGTALYATPFSDQQFVTAMFNRMGVEEKNQTRWQEFFTQEKAPGIINMLYPYSEHKTEKVINVAKRYCSLLSEFAETFPGKYTPYGMWDRHYEAIAKILGQYAGLYITMEAKFNGLIPWEDIKYTNSMTTFIQGYRQVTRNCNSSFGGCPIEGSKKMTGANSYLANADFPFSVSTTAEVAGMMHLSSVEFIEAIDLNLGNTENSLWWMISGSDANVCSDRNFGIPYIVECSSKNEDTHFSFTNSGTMEEVLANSFTSYMLSQQEHFRTARFPVENLLDFLKQTVPFWASIDDLQNGNNEAGTLGLISDVMMFLPMGKFDDVLDGITAFIPKKIRKGMRFKHPPISVKQSNNYRAMGGKPDKHKYKDDSRDTLPKIDNNSWNGFSSNISGRLPSKGRPSNLSQSKPNRKPESAANDMGANLDSKYFGDKGKLKKNQDGSYTGDDGKTYVKNGDDYFSAEKDKETGEWFLTDKDGNRGEPVKQDGDGNWASNKGVALTVNDMYIFGAQKVHVGHRDKAVRRGNGIYRINNKVNAVKVGDTYFKAEYDPVSKNAYVHTKDWERKPLLAPIRKEWYKDNQAARSCTYTPTPRP